jgi:hypothetical protein
MQGVYHQEEATVAREDAEWGQYLEIVGDARGDKKDLRAPV